MLNHVFDIKHDSVTSQTWLNLPISVTKMCDKCMHSRAWNPNIYWAYTQIIENISPQLPNRTQVLI